jgi:hypothetical protein
MSPTHTKGEAHGCIVCGKLYQLYVIYDDAGKFIDCKVMSPGAKRVVHATRPLVACEQHSDEQIAAAVQRAYGTPQDEDE